MYSKYYQVEKILEKRSTPAGVQYLIKWEGWPKEDSTWEPLENLKKVSYMVNEFDRKQKNSPKSKEKTEKKIVSLLKTRPNHLKKK